MLIYVKKRRFLTDGWTTQNYSSESPKKQK